MANKEFDAIVVGSGATGGVAAKELAERGLKVLVLEAGPALDEALFDKPGKPGPVTSIDRMVAGAKGQYMQARASWYSPDKSFLFVNDYQNPYTTSADDFLWVRGHQVGGRFHSWGRVAVRMSDYDFKAASQDGKGVDWPISYQDLEPYYSHIEEFLGIAGKKDDIPNLPDGKFETEAGFSKLEQRFKEKIESRWSEAHVTPWRYVRKEATHADDKGQKRITSPLAAGLKTGNLEIRPDAMVCKIVVDPSTGKASGVSYIDRVTKETYTADANVVMLCASTIESIRLLFNSECDKYPDGLANSSGLLGRYFMDQTPSLIFGTVPGSSGFELVDGSSPADNHGGFYIPRFQNMSEATTADYARGYNIQGLAGRIPVPDSVPALFGLTAQGEMLPSYENRVKLNRQKRDAWGVPVADIRISMTDNERMMLKDQIDTTLEMVKEAGWSVEIAASLLGVENKDRLMPNSSWFERFMFKMSYKKSLALGAAIHECGGARMGSDPKESVLNGYNQCWDVTNLFVTDSSCFASNGSCGPTLTTMALTARACDYIGRVYDGTRNIPSAV